MTTSPKRVPEGRQPLLVPWTRRDEASRLGARWHHDMRAWSIAPDKVGNVPREMLPLRDRPGVSAPYIRINLIPQTSWGRNLRGLMDQADWKSFARNNVYSATGSLCLVCGGRGPEWPVEADEVWHFDDANGTQRLNAVVPLCPDCHEVRSAGLARTNGRGEQAARHFAWVDRIDVSEARRRIDRALEEWQRRSRRTWRIDLSMMKERYGIDIEHDAGRTDNVNVKLVDEARSRRGSRRSSVSKSDLMTHLFGGG